MGLQLVTSGAGELGVQGQYLDSERHLVDDTLAGSMPTAEKLQVLDAVVSSNAVDVVNGLASKKITTKVLGHDVAMFQHTVLRPGHEGWNRQPHVSVFLDMSFVLAALEARKSILPLVLAFAGVVTKFLFNIKPAARFAALNLIFATRKAREFVFLLLALFSAFGRTRDGTVQRFTPKFLFVGGQVCRPHGKRVAAFLAGKKYRGFAGSRLVLIESEVTAASKAAKSSILAGVAVKRLLTFFTDSFDRHGYAPLFGNKGGVAVSFAVVK